MSTPFFSVVIPAFNVASCIDETLASVFQQSFADFEVLVINDGSTDDTAQKLAGIQDERLRVLHIDNQGVSHARNMGIRLAQGKYIAFLDGDDVWAPTHLESAALFFREHANVPWWSSGYYAASTPKLCGKPWVSERSQVLPYFSLPSLIAYPSSVILAASSAKALLPLFPEGMSNAEDWAAWATYAHKHPLIGFCPVEDVLYRQRTGSATQGRSADAQLRKLMAISTHLASHEHEPGSPQSRYFRYRALQRWLLLFALLVPRSWKTELRAQRPLLGLPLYILIRCAASVLFGTCHLVCKLLHEINQLQEKRIRKNL